MNQVYIANFGEGNALWPVAKQNDTIITIDNVVLHPFWQANDRDGYIDAAIAHTETARGEKPSRQTAGRWYNLVTELRDTEDDLWISRQGDVIWWTISKPGDLREQVRPSTNSKRDGPEVWHIEKPCQPWSEKDKEGRTLRWSALHPKGSDFLATEATFQKIANDRGYADYARALIAGEALDTWHQSQIFVEKAALAKKQVGRIFSPKEIAAARMTRTLMATVSQANGQIVERSVKEKTTTLSVLEWEKLLREKMGEQGDKCALTGLPIGYDKECEDTEMLASLDRIDSNGHYTPENVQIVCRFINRWKGADDDILVRRLLSNLGVSVPGTVLVSN